MNAFVHLVVEDVQRQRDEEWQAMLRRPDALPLALPAEGGLRLRLHAVWGRLRSRRVEVPAPVPVASVGLERAPRPRVGQAPTAATKDAISG